MHAPRLTKSAERTSGYTYAEVEEMLARGDVRGRLSRDDLPTPALTLDLGAFEFNVAKMAGHCREHRRALASHV